MNRRGFLKLTALLSSSVLLNFTGLSEFGSMSHQVQSRELLFKGNSDGEIFYSRDSGKTWLEHTRFASGTSIIDLAVDRSERVYALLGYSGYTFQLKLALDGRSWMTV